MQFHIHLGAHKTATTFVQRTLRENGPALKAAGIAAPELVALRKRFTARFDRVMRGGRLAARLFDAALRRDLAALLPSAPGIDRTILSDENFVGVLGANTRGRGLYPDAGARARVLAGLVGQGNVHWFLAIRDYADFTTSAYLQAASHRAAPAFDAYVEAVHRGQRGWADIVEELVRLSGPDRVTVWTYERFRAEPRAIFDVLAPGADLALAEAEDAPAVNTSLTVKGLKVMQRLEGHLTPAELNHMGKLMKRFPFEAPNPRLTITDADLLAKLGARYEADRARIRATGCRFLDVEGT